MDTISSVEKVRVVPDVISACTVESKPQAVQDLRSMRFYKDALMKNLDPKIFKSNPRRLIGFAICGAVSIGIFLTIVELPLIWPVKFVLGLLIGFSNGTLGFLTHELSHGSIIKNRRAQDALAFLGTLPFFISPTFWKFWHNKLHHGRTQQLIRDPDAFPNLRIYKSSRFMKNMFPYTPGSGHKRSFLYFFFWFSFHNFVAQTYLRFRNSVFNTLDHRRVTLEFSAQVLIGAALLAYAGPANWPWVFLVPLMAQNYLLMSFISTNHNLSPLTSENDPLVNSLSVSTPRIFEFLNLNFGYHVEHHLFPTVNGRHAKAIHRELVRQFSGSYKIMPKWKAMKALYSTPRIYKNSVQLIHPETMATHATLE